MPNSFLQNKTILIISPQPWCSLYISKFHYAKELSKRNNKVFFLNPPIYKTNIGINISPDENDTNIQVITYRPFFPFLSFLRFKFRLIFDLLMAIQIKKIKKHINLPLDILWCFEPNLYSNLKKFNAGYIIYHPVDLIEKKYQLKPAYSANIVLSVSNSLIDKFKFIKVQKCLINHGLAEPFERIANQHLNNLTEYVQNNPVKIGYIGNLMIHSIDHNMFLRIIETNSNIEFHFWGQSDENSHSFIKKIKTNENVVFHGYKKPELVCKEIQEMDGFVIFYLETKNTYDRSNSHKILEYLSTGKVIVSNEISTYKNQPNLLVMPQNDEDCLIPSLFHKVVNNLEYYNSPNMQKQRLEFALDNTYRKQIERIEELIEQKK